MRILLQRVKEARVEVDNNVVGAIGPGLLLLVGFEQADIQTDLAKMADKLLKLRIFADENGVMNRSILEQGGDILAVSQFTLFGDCTKGNRPSWSRAARADISRPLFEQFAVELSRQFGKAVACGIFGADMQVHLINDGPVTLLLDSCELVRPPSDLSGKSK